MEVYNSPEAANNWDRALLKDAYNLVRRLNEDEQDILGDFTFDSSMVETMEMGKRNSAAGVLGATYLGVARAFSQRVAMADEIAGEANRFRRYVADPARWKNGKIDPAPERIWPKFLHHVKITLLPKKDETSTDPRHWRPISNCQTINQSLFKCVRQHMVKSLGIPMMGPTDEKKERHFYSLFCAPGVVQEGFIPGGGVEVPLQLFQSKVDNARFNNTGLSVI